MKKFYYSLLAVATMLFAASCSQDEELVSASGSGEQNVTFSVQLPGATQTRAIADGVEVGGGNMANTLICALYEQGKTSETPLILKEIAERSDRVFELSLPMAKDLTYEILFMAYNKENCAFDVNFTEGDLTSVNLQALKLKSELKANQEAYDVFVGHITHKVNAEAVTLVKLNRPFAQVNAATTLGDLQNAETLKAVVTASELEIKGVPTTYNVFTGEATANATLTYKAADILKAVPATTPANEKISVEGDDYYYLAMAYVLAGKTATADKSLHDATFKFNRADGTTVSTVAVANLPIQRNYRTNVVGELLTKAEGFKVVVDQVFDEPAEGVSYWDGKAMKEPAVENGAYVIRSAAEYAWLFNYANPITRAGSSLTGTIEIAADLNMGGYEISGITAARSGKLTINGNGHTISNAIVVSGDNDNGTSAASMFVCLPTSELNINKLNVEGVNVVTDENVAHGYAGVIAAYVEGTLNLTEVNVLNSSVHSTQSIGGMLGFVAANGIVSIKDCTVDGVKLTNADVADESGAMGGLVGRVAAATLTVENTTVSNSTIDAYVGTAEDQKRSISKYIGNFVGGGTINVTNGVIENVTINAKNELAKTQSCLYGDFLGGWRTAGGTVTINGVKYDKAQGPLRAMIGDASYATLTEAIAAAQAGDEIVLADGTYNGLFDLTHKELTISALDKEAKIEGMVWADDCKVTLKGLTFSNPNGVKHPNPQNSQYYNTINNQYPVIGAYNKADITMEDCTFELVALTVYGFYGYAHNTPKFIDCTFNCNKIRPIASNGPAIQVNGCTFNDPYHYAVRMFENSGEKQTVEFTGNTIQGTNDKGEFEGINISKKGDTATILADFTIKGNTKGLAYRHNKAVTMNTNCTYDTDIENFSFVSE